MGGGCKKTTILRQSSSASLYRNPLIEQKHRNSSTEDDKENTAPPIPKSKTKPSSLELCIGKHEPDSVVGFRAWDSNVWDYSDSESAPASSWSTLPNRSLLCRPLPVDVGRCTCIILKESSADGGTLYTLFTHEGKGRENRKLAVAHHARRRGRSEFRVGQTADENSSIMGAVTCNIMGSKYLIWDQGHSSKSTGKEGKLLGGVKFMATVSSWTGNYRSMRAWIPEHHHPLQQLKNANIAQGNKDRVHHLFSKAPFYNKFTRQYELDFRDRGRTGLKIQSSVKNFQLTLERNGKHQTLLQMGRLGKSKYVMDYRYPLSGYQAFCMCLASIDSKLCCTV